MKPGGTEMLTPLDHDPPQDPSPDAALKAMHQANTSSSHTQQRLESPHSLIPHNGSLRPRRSLYLQPVML